MKSNSSTWGRGARFLAISSETRRKIRRTAASAFALTFAFQSFAWAVCADGSTFPQGGYRIGTAPIATANNFNAPGFTATNGSLFIPDSSVNENNDPNQPLTAGGHNWAFDQGSTLCKMGDVGAGGATATGWNLPPVSSTDCIELPIIRNGAFVNIGGLPWEGQAITPTCNPALLSTATTPNPANTYANQLGCAIEQAKHGVDPATGQPRATTLQTADSYMGVGDIRGGVFAYQLIDSGNTAVGTESGKTVGALNWYSHITDQLVDTVSWALDGHFLVATSTRRENQVYACLDPLGYPGDPLKPIPSNFFIPSGSSVLCMQVGQTGLAVTLTNNFGPDNQPYFGGQRVVNTFNSTPGGTQITAWPQCIYENDGGVPFPPSTTPNPTVAQQEANFVSEFTRNSQNHCGQAFGNSGWTAALVTQPNDLKTHGQYMYAPPIGGTVIQMKVTQALSGQSSYQFRQYVTGLPFTNGVGVADDLGSLMTMSDPSGIGAAGDEVITRLPLCEDM